MNPTSADPQSVTPPQSRAEIRRMLAEYGITDEIPANTTPCDLTNPIHPLFARKNWMAMPDNIWRQLKPACQLASKYLEVHELKAWFVKMTQGRLIIDHGMTRNYIEDVRITRENLTTTTEMLIEMADYVQFSMGAWLRNGTESARNTDAETKCVWVRTVANGRAPPSFVQSVSEQDRVNYKSRIEVDFHENYWKYLTQTDPATRSPGEYACMMYLLAEIMVHELAHCFEELRFNYTLEQHAHDFDVYYNAFDDFPELGWALEKHLFPMRICGDVVFAGKNYLPKGGLWVGNWSDIKLDETGDVTVHAAKEVLGIPVAWVHQWFSQKFWDTLDNGGWHRQPRPDFRVKGGELFNRYRRRYTAFKPKLYDLSNVTGW